MDVYLSGISGLKKQFASGDLLPEDIFALESFFSMSDWEIPLIPRFGKFMLDSGAFTFIYGKKNKSIDWEKYADAYADFVRANNVQLFFELDIDAIVGLDEVERLRERIEKRVERQSIPVWHKNRGKEYFLRMCAEYPYVAIGGMAGKGKSSEIDKYLFWFINTAHKHGTKIHGLGYTKTKELELLRFDSVDSTTWTNAGRYGELHRFTGYSIERIISMEKGRKVRSLKNPQEAMWHNFREWVKFQKYMIRK